MTDNKANSETVPAPFVKRYYQVARRESGYLRFITESYDGLLFVRTLDNRIALVEVAYPESRCKDAEALLCSLVRETGLQSVAAPEVIPEL